MEVGSKKRLKAMVDSAVALMAEEKGISTERKDLAKEAEESFGVKKKVFNRIVKAIYKEEFEDVVEENERFEELYKEVTKSEEGCANGTCSF